MCTCTCMLCSQFPFEVLMYVHVYTVRACAYIPIFTCIPKYVNTQIHVFVCSGSLLPATCNCYIAHLLSRETFVNWAELALRRLLCHCIFCGFILSTCLFGHLCTSFVFHCTCWRLSHAVWLHHMERCDYDAIVCFETPFLWVNWGTQIIGKQYLLYPN